MVRSIFNDIRFFECLDSTNLYVKEEAVRGSCEGLVAVADYQTAGRGRLDRKWEAPKGSGLLFSILFRPDLEEEQLFLCTNVVALAAREACQSVAGVQVDIKWPNDLLIHEKKLAGILAEVVREPVGFEGNSVRWPAVVVGIGINLSTSGPESASGIGLEKARGYSVDREALLSAVLDGLCDRYGLLGNSAGRAQLHDEYIDKCKTIGKRVRVDLGERALVGQALGLSPNGQLILQDDRETIEIAVGDVVHLRLND